MFARTQFSLIFANLLPRESKVLAIKVSFIDYMSTCSRIQEFANNSETENSRNKSHAKISELTVYASETIRGLCGR